MFGFDWSEIAVIAVVALICIGPKDMPVAIRAITAAIKKMRRMAGEFQSHVDDMLKEADLHEVTDTLRDIRGMNVRNAITRAVDPDGSIGRNLSDPFSERPVPPVQERFVPAPPVIAAGPPPAFVPPGVRAAAIGPAPDFVPPHSGLSNIIASHAQTQGLAAEAVPAETGAAAPASHAEDI